MRKLGTPSTHRLKLIPQTHKPIDEDNKTEKSDLRQDFFMSHQKLFHQTISLGFLKWWNQS